ncbi:MAG: PHP domain-containing protein, partial [Anaerolineae bacterium]|nr:PHP domain-containing protein [Anaerolineae bacterium]
MLRGRWADLHVHTVLSACAEVEMIPPLIVRRALELGLEWIAVTDHNSAGNVRAVQAAAEGMGLTVMPGLEVESREEVHLVCLFDTAEQAEAYAAVVAAHLPQRLNDERHFGAQYVVDAAGEYVRTEERLLLTSADLSIDEIVRGVGERGGEGRRQGLRRMPQRLPRKAVTARPGERTSPAAAGLFLSGARARLSAALAALALLASAAPAGAAGDARRGA